jgi:hypothetical protein
VPASRPASHLKPTIELSRFLGVPLVVLCSKETKVEDVVQQISRTPEVRSLVVEISKTWSHPDFPRGTSTPVFLSASANRGSDLSAKRNIGLMLARLHAWSKIAFIDDDIRRLDSRSVARLAAQLDKHKVAGMSVRGDTPDNSVVCHARRLARLPQDVFVTAAVLGVRCNDLPLPFFPDIYNEDWFFFANEAANRDIRSVGQAWQAEYDPFETPQRARHEEFGDLLAEGLYALFGRQRFDLPFHKRLDRATTTFWSYFMEARLEVIKKARRALYRLLDQDPSNAPRVYSALHSLRAARHQLRDAIKPDLCANFIVAWRNDLAEWQKYSSGVNTVGSTGEALDFLQLKTWHGPNLVLQRPSRKKRRILGVQ